MPPQLTILIVTLNRRDILEKTLWHIYETSTDEERNIWIWDNASTDDTADFLGTMVGWPGVRVFRSKVGVGNAASRTKMMAVVDTPYVFTLDDDWWLLNRGWASGVCRVLAGDPSIHQVALGPFPHPTSDYGISHTKLDRPFFRIPPHLPGPKANIEGVEGPAGTKVVRIDGEAVIVPESGPQLPFSCSAGAAAWRVADIKPLLHGQDKFVVDLRETWGFPQYACGTRESTIIGYGAHHPSPGPLWHLGRGETYWEERCRFAQEVYGRSGEQQHAWLEVARKESGWGRPLDDPDEVLK